MTVVVAFLCTDGVVVAADSMLTPSLGNLNVGHHKGLKVEVLQGGQVFAFAGDQGQGARFKLWADTNHALPANQALALDYPLALTQGLVQQFQATGIGNAINVNTVLGFMHDGLPQCSVFEGAIQPRLLDRNHYYVALGTGKLSADPFMRFLVDVFCANGPPNVREAVFLAAWTIQHSIETAPGLIAEPIRIATIEPTDRGGFQARSLPENEISEHRQAMESAADALRKWRDEMQSGAAADDVPDPPDPPQDP